jgi:hypothetical protein
MQDFFSAIGKIFGFVANFVCGQGGPGSMTGFGGEAFDGVEPGAPGRREVEGEAFVAREPSAHLGMLLAAC